MTLADYSVLVVGNGHQEFGRGVNETWYGKSRQNANAAFLMGIQSIIVVVNKMDCSDVSWSQDRYMEICNN